MFAGQPRAPVPNATPVAPTRHFVPHRLAIATAQLAFQASVPRTTLSKIAEAAAPLITAGVLATAATPALAGDADAGQVIFSGNCAACHRGGQNVIMPMKTLEKAVRLHHTACPKVGSTASPWHETRLLTPFHPAVHRIVHPTPQALEEYLDGGFSEAAVMKQVTNGKNAMPAFGGRLSDEDIADVATYVITNSAQGWD